MRLRKSRVLSTAPSLHMRAADKTISAVPPGDPWLGEKNRTCALSTPLMRMPTPGAKRISTPGSMRSSPASSTTMSRRMRYGLPDMLNTCLSLISTGRLPPSEPHMSQHSSTADAQVGRCRLIAKVHRPAAVSKHSSRLRSSGHEALTTGHESPYATPRRTLHHRPPGSNFKLGTTFGIEPPGRAAALEALALASPSRRGQCLRHGVVARSDAGEECTRRPQIGPVGARTWRRFATRLQVEL